MKNKITYLIAVLILHITGYGQITVDKPIKLTGITVTDRQIENVAAPETQAQILSAEMVQKNLYRYGVAVGTDSLKITIPSGIGFYTEGCIIYFKAANVNTGPVSMSVNNLPFHALKLFPNQELTASQLKPNQVYCAVFSGNEFQLLSPLEKECPSGFTAVNKMYCIENNEHPTTDLFSAMKTCNDMNARLCKWGEWYYACQKGLTGVLNMTNNNWEWTDDAANHNVRVTGKNACTALSNSAMEGPYNFRCCFSK